MAMFFIDAANKKVQLHKSFYLIGSNERFKILEAYCFMRIGDKTKADALKETVQLELFDSFSKAYDSIFYYAIDSQKDLSEKKREIEAIGYRTLANLLGLNL